MNATVFPSGEILGWISPSDPSGGEVSFCFSPVSRATRKMERGSWEEFWHDTASNSPSGDQDGARRSPSSSTMDGRSIILRSVPPNDDIKYSPLPSLVERTKAM